MTMPEASAIVYQCPGCRKAVEPGEDYVAAWEYEYEPDFTLHMKGRALDSRAACRFHVAHFRSRLGDHVYELVREESPL